MADSVLLETSRDGSLGKAMNMERWQRPVKAGGRGSALAGLALGCACCLAAPGCKSVPDAKNEDPLFGVRPPQVAPVPPAASSPIANPPQASWNGVPPPPGAVSSGSTAAMASLPGGNRPLRINEAPPVPASSGGPSVQPLPREPVGGGSGLMTTGGWTQPVPGTVTSLPPASPQLTQDQALAQLQARGAVGSKVERTANGQFLVSALIADRTGQVRHVEARGATAEDAVQAILREVGQ